MMSRIKSLRSLRSGATSRSLPPSDRSALLAAALLVAERTAVLDPHDEEAGTHRNAVVDARLDAAAEVHAGLAAEMEVESALGLREQAERLGRRTRQRR